MHQQRIVLPIIFPSIIFLSEDSGLRLLTGR